MKEVVCIIALVFFALLLAAGYIDIRNQKYSVNYMTGVKTNEGGAE